MCDATWMFAEGLVEVVCSYKETFYLIHVPLVRMMQASENPCTISSNDAGVSIVFHRTRK